MKTLSRTNANPTTSAPGVRTPYGHAVVAVAGIWWTPERPLDLLRQCPTMAVTRTW